MWSDGAQCKRTRGTFGGMEMKTGIGSAFAAIAAGAALAIAGCGGGGSNGGNGGGGGGTTTYLLTVNSTSPSSGVAINVTPADNNAAGGGSTSFTRTYNAGTTVTLTAPSTSSGNPFSSWSGCTSASTVTCTVTLNANATVTANYTAPTTYVLTVNSTAPGSGVAITVTPADDNAAANGTTSFTRTYNAGTTVTLTAPASAGGNPFGSWTGCTSASTVTCTITVNAAATVTANFTGAAVTGVTVTPATPVVIGTSQQFSASVAGTGSFTSGVTWSVAAPSGSGLSAGTITSSGLYQTPYPAPATVTVTATSTFDATQSGSATIALSPPPTAAGPALSVDAGNQTRPISPLIYGMNNYLLDTGTVTAGNISISRWGGDDTSRYNYLTNTSNSASDYYFLNGSGSGGMWPDGSFNSLVKLAAENGMKVLGTVPVQGWVANSTQGACSFTATQFPGQQSYQGACGNGIDPEGVNGCTSSGGCDLNGNSGPMGAQGATAFAEVTSIAAPPPALPAANAVNAAWAQGTWAGAWVNSLVTQFGQGNPASGNGAGVSFYDLDNEPSWWDAVHRDVHPVASTYDEVSQGGIGTALAIKTADPTAKVNGPVVDYWWNYFYSKKDIESGWGSGPCYEPWQNPIDREAHGGVPFIEYYLQQFAAAQTTYGVRLLDYVVLHTYDAASYNGNSVAFATAGDTGVQQARMNSTRAFWDPTYTDPNLPQPNYSTDANYTSSCNTPLQAPQLINMLHGWVAKDYPGTKIAIDEYNWGGLESINGAVTQADILGIFGAYGLDLATLWPTQAPSTQVPGTMAFAMYRNYDGSKSTFGDTALASTSANQAQLSIYGALRSSDGALTVMVINKTYGSLTDTIDLANFTANGSASAYQYSNANLAAIQALPAIAVAAPAGGSTTSTLSATFPAQSITLLVIPAK